MFSNYDPDCFGTQPLYYLVSNLKHFQGMFEINNIRPSQSLKSRSTDAAKNCLLLTFTQDTMHNNVAIRQISLSLTQSIIQCSSESIYQQNTFHDFRRRNVYVDTRQNVRAFMTRILWGFSDEKFSAAPISDNRKLEVY